MNIQSDVEQVQLPNIIQRAFTDSRETIFKNGKFSDRVICLI